MVFLDGPIQVQPEIDDKIRFQAEIEWLEKQISQKEKTDCKWNSSIVTVGTGRGFVVQGTRDRYIITAGRCLPTLPACDISSELMYPELIGPLAGDRTVPAGANSLTLYQTSRCSARRNQKNLRPVTCKGPGDSDRYSAFTNGVRPLSVAEPLTRCLAWVPLPAGSWFRCILIQEAHDLRFYNHFGPLGDVIAGSPLVADNGSAIGVLCDNSEWNEQVLYPRLASALPGWLLRELQVTAVV